VFRNALMALFLAIIPALKPVFLLWFSLLLSTAMCLIAAISALLPQLLHNECLSATYVTALVLQLQLVQLFCAIALLAKFTLVNSPMLVLMLLHAQLAQLKMQLVFVNQTALYSAISVLLQTRAVNTSALLNLN
jgi:glucan phosphoethanolaminetransferase (alkaline phosphatase superfamily)